MHHNFEQKILHTERKKLDYTTDHNLERVLPRKKEINIL